MDLKKIVTPDIYNGILVIPDLHDNTVALEGAIRYAHSLGLFMVFLGDLSDSENDDPVPVTEMVAQVVIYGRGALVIGNHDDKYMRYMAGNDVTFSPYQEATLERAGDRRDFFLQCYASLALHDNTNHYAHHGDIFFTHAATHPSIWDRPEKLSRVAKGPVLHGMTNGERDEDDYPVRIYPWLKHVPAGKKLFVGHDHNPLGISITGKQPMINNILGGGSVFFMDTGSGKGGHLTTAVLTFEGDSLAFAKFKAF